MKKCHSLLVLSASALLFLSACQIAKKSDTVSSRYESARPAEDSDSANIRFTEADIQRMRTYPVSESYATAIVKEGKKNKFVYRVLDRSISSVGPIVEEATKFVKNLTKGEMIERLKSFRIKPESGSSEQALKNRLVRAYTEAAIEGGAKKDASIVKFAREIKADLGKVDQKLPPDEYSKKCQELVDQKLNAFSDSERGRIATLLGEKLAEGTVAKNSGVATAKGVEIGSASSSGAIGANNLVTTSGAPPTMTVNLKNADVLLKAISNAPFKEDFKKVDDLLFKDIGNLSVKDWLGRLRAIESIAQKNPELSELRKVISEQIKILAAYKSSEGKMSVISAIGKTQRAFIERDLPQYAAKSEGLKPAELRDPVVQLVASALKDGKLSREAEESLRHIDDLMKQAFKDGNDVYASKLKDLRGKVEDLCTNYQFTLDGVKVCAIYVTSDCAALTSDTVENMILLHDHTIAKIKEEGKSCWEIFAYSMVDFQNKVLGRSVFSSITASKYLIANCKAGDKKLLPGFDAIERSIAGGAEPEKVPFLHCK